MIKIILSSLIILSISCLNSMYAQNGKYNYDQFHESDFPAYIELIQFENGALMSASSSVTWGSWTISFPSKKLPTCGGGNGDLHIVGLIASNPVIGEFKCDFHACKECRYSEGTSFKRRCRLIIFDDTHSFNKEIIIECPILVRLKK